MSKMCHEIERRPHVVTATPGRLRAVMDCDSWKSGGKKLRTCFKRVRWLVLDEADRLLEEEFEDDMKDIMSAIPAGKEQSSNAGRDMRRRQTLLFSATRTRRVNQIQKVACPDVMYIYEEDKQTNMRESASGKDAIPIPREVIKTVEGLTQQLLFIPERVKDVYLVAFLDELVASSNPPASVRSVIIFCSTCRRAQLTTYLLRSLTKPTSSSDTRNGGLNDKKWNTNYRNNITVLHSRLGQQERTASLLSFKSLPSQNSQGSLPNPRLPKQMRKQQDEQMRVLIATDVASRGLDIPHVDLVIHLDLPNDVYDYVHR